ncbi:hypothetical protein LTR64_002447 [Lithohypha guttulata]|uniref:uncharacterized protein n=1 Tax=Lithohypha guttulata TaxID=1690604 RepID=UPI002DE1B862|nr:hypothetical protein LTR51_001327 [Lithohypha guttulata]
MSGGCAVCEEPLVVLLESDSEAEDSKQSADTSDSVPDDVELNCGCHFHWECFLESYTITQCPNCSKDISSSTTEGQQQVLCTVRNEGGVQPNFDILPTATEEAYLRAFPEERRGHAFLEFCREGDIDAVLHLIKDDPDNDIGEEDEEETDILRYVGTFEGISGSALHVAVRYQQEEVAWLLLAIASNLDWAKFPQPVLQAMQSLGLSKSDRKAEPDIRTLKDDNGMTALDLAKEIGGFWSAWIADGRFNA